MALGTGFLDDYLPYLLRRADQTLSEAFYAVLTESGVARSEWRVLAVLEELGPLSVLDLTDAALSPQPTVTHAVRRLEARGLVTRTAGATDRRQRIVAITEEGAALTRRLISAARRLETAALADLGGGEDLVEPLRRLISSLEGARA
ncbi:MAG: MarR family transcriptional regulator [Acidimicrobiaceae bacterium]|jgi:DNA-binding MarR family transcriptional regulator